MPPRHCVDTLSEAYLKNAVLFTILYILVRTLVHMILKYYYYITITVGIALN